MMDNVYDYYSSGAEKSRMCHERNVQNLWLPTAIFTCKRCSHHISQLISCVGGCSGHMAAAEPLPEKAAPTTCRVGECSLITILEIIGVRILFF